jgi:hypothetical protein
MKKLLLWSAFCLGATPALQAALLNEAVLAFPVQTYSLEYDALNNLRALPNYRNLRQQYSGEGLQKAQKDLLELGISEDQLSEVVTAAGANGFFGMLAGTFQTPNSTEAAKHGLSKTVLEDGGVFCAQDGYCFLFLKAEQGRAFFGPAAQIKAISDVRQGRAQSLRSNATVMNLVNRMEPNAPVFGIAPGREIGQWIGDAVPSAIASRFNFTSLFSSVESFGYSVKIDSKAHVGLNLLCTSDEAGTMIGDTLGAASGLQRAAALAAGSGAMPFEKMVVRSSGRLVAVNLDAPIQ